MAARWKRQRLWQGTLKSGTLVAAVVLLLLLCLPLLIKLLVILFVFRLTAAAAEFICEERLVECIAAAGEYIGLLLGIVFSGRRMFSFRHCFCWEACRHDGGICGIY